MAFESLPEPHFAAFRKHRGLEIAMALALFSLNITYLAFLSVGTSCGWFVSNGLYNLIANEPQIGRGGSMT